MLGVFAFVVWLALASNHNKTFRDSFNLASKSGLIGGLSEDETQKLSGHIQNALKSASLKTNFSINGALDESRLDVITFRAGIDVYPKLGILKPGNAAYEPNFDVIFLDAEQVRSALAGEDGNVLAPAKEMFLIVTILHELGLSLIHI